MPEYTLRYKGATRKVTLEWPVVAKCSGNPILFSIELAKVAYQGMVGDGQYASFLSNCHHIIMDSKGENGVWSGKVLDSKFTFKDNSF